MDQFTKIFFAAFTFAVVLPAFADGPADNQPDNVRPVPPIGIEIPSDVQTDLLTACKEIRESWSALTNTAKEKANTSNKNAKVAAQAELQKLLSLESEVLVFPRAIELAIEFPMFYRPADIEQARGLLKEAGRRIEAIKNGGGWSEVVGLGDGRKQKLIVGGYRSKIDGSFQPYSIVVPSGLMPGDARPRRLDLWFHGRGEKMSEVNFLHKQQVVTGQYAPADCFVLHPYGRYSNAFKFAGEIDVLEVLEYIKGRLPVDDARVSVRGFSMGGAGCWQMAVHYPDLFFAANPGAGFSETPEFLDFFQGEDARGNDPDYQQTLWQLYDCPPWAINLTGLPTVAYSGEVDRQKQAADVMEATLAKHGIKLTHIIGPNTAHKIHPDSKIEIEARMRNLEKSISPHVPRRIQFATVSLRYHRQHWVDVQGLGKHWSPAAVDASIDSQEVIRVTTKNVNALRLAFDSGQWPGEKAGATTIVIDGKRITGPFPSSDLSLHVSLVKKTDDWTLGEPTDRLRKRPGLQGPIDDALMDSFVFVTTKRKSSDPKVQAWLEAELEHAMVHWRKHFRGDVRQIDESELTDEITSQSNLLVFGDPRAGGLAGDIVEQLPITWDSNLIKIGPQQVPANGRVAALVYPNPLNPNRYVVLNSGFTYREYAYLNNARQTPKLSDWALIDIRSGATSRLPGVVEKAGFFDENWKP